MAEFITMGFDMSGTDAESIIEMTLAYLSF